MKKNLVIRLLKWTLISFSIFVLSFILLNFLFPLKSPPEFSRIITDKDGNVMYAFLSPDEKWRMKTNLDEINPLLRKTLLFKEDKYFYFHPGINPVAVIRAAFNNITHGKTTSGASTITMQVARMLYPAKRNVISKLTEMFRSLQIELYYSKDEILQLYINMVPFGGNIEGVKSASLFYFGVKPAHVNLSQAVILSIIPNRPGSLNPGKGTTKIMEERNKWLHRMKVEHIVSEGEADEAIAEIIDMKRRPVPRNIPHLALKLKSQNPESSTIKTTIDKRIQDKAENISFNHHRKLSLKNIQNLAVLVIENRSSKVRAYVGSQDFNDVFYSGQVDGCNAVRSPGSTLKPMVYALAIDKGIITPATMLEDVPVNFAGYAPENFNSRCNGMVPASKALAYSLNIPAVGLLNETGLNEFTNKLRKCGFASLHGDNEMGLSVILGGCGVKLTEIAGMYTMFANGGLYKPIKLLESDTSHRSSQVISEAAAFMVTEMLTGLVRPDLPNNYESSLTIPKIAWKTGTSYGRRDAWSVGYNRNYTIAVWAGNFNGLGVPDLTGADIATPLLFDLFNAIDHSSENYWYAAPASADLRLVCSQSGLPPGELCTNLISDYYIPSVSSNKKCNHSKEVFISHDGSFSYCAQCVPESGYKMMVADNLPPAVASFYAGNNIEFNKLPPHNPACTQLLSGHPPVITSPVNNKEYLLEKEINQPLQLSCVATSGVSLVYWYVNDKFLTKCKPGEQAFFEPEGGAYKISCTDDKGMNSDINIMVKLY